MCSRSSNPVVRVVTQHKLCFFFCFVFWPYICRGKIAQKIRAPCPASPVHRLRRCPAFGRAGCIIKLWVVKLSKPPLFKKVNRVNKKKYKLGDMPLSPHFCLLKDFTQPNPSSVYSVSHPGWTLGTSLCQMLA